MEPCLKSTLLCLHFSSADKTSYWHLYHPEDFHGTAAPSWQLHTLHYQPPLREFQHSCIFLFILTFHWNFTVSSNNPMHFPFFLSKKVAGCRACQGLLPAPKAPPSFWAVEELLQVCIWLSLEIPFCKQAYLNKVLGDIKTLQKLRNYHIKGKSPWFGYYSEISLFSVLVKSIWYLVKSIWWSTFDFCLILIFRTWAECSQIPWQYVMWGLLEQVLILLSETSWM